MAPISDVSDVLLASDSLEVRIRDLNKVEKVSSLARSDGEVLGVLFLRHKVITVTPLSNCLKARAENNEMNAFCRSFGEEESLAEKKVAEQSGKEGGRGSRRRCGCGE